MGRDEKEHYRNCPKIPRIVCTPHDLDIWSNGYFLQLAGIVKYA
jgi:hypothetical protein